MLDRQSNLEASMAKLVNRIINALRENPWRCAWLFGGLVVVVVMFTLADILPAPYDF